MNHEAIAKQLAHNAETIRSTVTGLSDEQMRWKPTAKEWSILEVVNHLYDEEREDFRQRVDYVLHRPGEQPPGIDPEGWVTARGYNLRDADESVQNFLDERWRSIAWLEGLEEPQWDNAYTHPSGFKLHAGDLLSSWLAHDFLHLRQLVELHYAWVRQQSAPYAIDYAGDW